MRWRTAGNRSSRSGFGPACGPRRCFASCTSPCPTAQCSALSPPSTRSLTLFPLSGPRALFSFLGSRPAKQLSLHERSLCLGLLAGVLISTTFANFIFLRLVCLSLVVGVSLAADLAQARRLGDARFLFLWGWFHVPMGLSFWACSAGGAAKAKALASKLTLAGVEA